MAALWKLSLVLVSVALCIALSTSKEALADPEDAVMFSDFSDSAKANSGWLACNFTESPGASCYDCNTILICKKVGGFLIPCWWPTKNNCVEGSCEAAPSDECAPSTTAETSAPTEPATTVPALEVN